MAPRPLCVLFIARFKVLVWRKCRSSSLLHFRFVVETMISKWVVRTFIDTTNGLKFEFSMHIHGVRRALYAKLIKRISLILDEMGNISMNWLIESFLLACIDDGKRIDPINCLHMFSTFFCARRSRFAFLNWPNRLSSGAKRCERGSLGKNLYLKWFGWKKVECKILPFGKLHALAARMERIFIGIPTVFCERKQRKHHISNDQSRIMVMALSCQRDTHTHTHTLSLALKPWQKQPATLWLSGSRTSNP